MKILDKSFRILAVTLAALVWNSLAYCGEIQDAATAGDLAKINTLLATNSSLVNAKDDNNVTPLMCAIHFGKIEAAKLLLEKGADVNAKNRIGQTALFEASANGQLEVVKLLLEKGAAVNFVVHDDAEGDDSGCTPLLLAAENGQLEVAKLLLEKGADVNAKSSYNTIHECATPLIGATEVSSDFEKLGGGPLPGNRVVADKKHGYLEVVKLLLDKGATIDAKNNFGNTALFLASNNGQVEVVKLLLDKGATVDAKNNQDITPLMMASQNGDVEVIKLLLAKGANPNAAMSGNKPWTPLTIATAEGLTNVVELLQNAAKHQ